MCKGRGDGKKQVPRRKVKGVGASNMQRDGKQ